MRCACSSFSFMETDEISSHNRSYGEAGMSHYQVLHVSPTSSVEEIRASYRAALLSVHPDKLGHHGMVPNRSEGGFSRGDAGIGARYLRVQEAWNVLKDADCRALYDASLRVRGGVDVGRNGEGGFMVGEEVVLEEMEEVEVISETGSLEFWYPCRCSDFFVVGERELQDAGLEVNKKLGQLVLDEGRQRQSILLPCGSCSLHLKVYFWVPCP